jgi:hypothetical protein
MSCFVPDLSDLDSGPYRINRELLEEIFTRIDAAGLEPTHERMESEINALVRQALSEPSTEVSRLW